jgi:phosphatidate cytidylyltransferase
MLKTRVITAIVLLTVLLAILSLNSFLPFLAVVALFFGAAIWECYRLFDNRLPVVSAAIWTAALVVLSVRQPFTESDLLFWICAAIWALLFGPLLGRDLPPSQSIRNRLLAGMYAIAILGCFGAILALFQRSPVYLVSVLAIIWIADIGAYFAGKAFGRRKLAPSISPGKSWEGAVGGWLAVLLLASVTTMLPAFEATFAAELQTRMGWGGFVIAMSLLVAASVIGDLFESKLKRRAGMKDSSHLLPGHGGVLDRVDALIPALPLAALLGSGF